MLTRAWRSIIGSAGVAACSIALAAGAGVAAWSIYRGQDPAIRDAPVLGQDQWPGVLRIGVTERLLPVNPLKTCSTYAAQLLPWVFDGLMEFSTSGELVPNLAAECRILDQDRTCEFRLRQGVRFHNGAPLTARDVACSYEAYRAKGAANQRRAKLLASLEAIEAVDDLTIRFVDRQSIQGFIAAASMWGILPRRLLGDPDARKAFDRHPIGSGPFSVKCGQPDGGVELVANPDYHRGRPRLERIVVKVFPSMTESWQQFLLGNIDMFDRAPPVVSSEIRRSSQCRVVEFPEKYLLALVFNPESPCMQDGRVRRLVSSAIDRRLLAGRLTAHKHAPRYSLFRHQRAGAEPQTAAAAGDEMASGCSGQPPELSQDENGWWHYRGAPLEIKVHVRNHIMDASDIPQALRQQLAAAGLRMQVAGDIDDRLGAAAAAADIYCVMMPHDIQPALFAAFWRQAALMHHGIPGRAAEAISRLAASAPDQPLYSLPACRERAQRLMAACLVIPLAAPLSGEIMSRRIRGDLAGFYQSNCSAAAVLGWHVP